MKRATNKRGFTLVELIVVIAIIGVLAAILVPTMMGMVTKSRITSANNTAASIRKNMNLLLLQADSNHFGIVPSKEMKFDITVNTSGGVTTWTCSAAPDGSYSNSNSSGIQWGTAASYTADGSMVGNTSGEKMICASLYESFPTMKEGAAVVVLYGGDCSFVAYTADQGTVLAATEYPTISNGSPAKSFVWDGQTAGISPNGLIVGTAPVIELGSGT